MPFLIAGIALAFILWVVGEPFLVEWRRKRLRAQPFPAAWRAILERRVPVYRRMPAPLREKLEQHIQVFLAEKSFAGADDFEITDEVRLVIAAQACLLILNRKSHYFPALRQVIVYPGTFVVDRIVPGPLLYSQTTRVLSGESWVEGRVILSWQDIAEGGTVVIHEFAHQLDQEKGYANGAPWLGSRHRYPRWSEVLGAEFARLQQHAALGEQSLFSYYGATEPAEFFAVASEVFFAQAAAMATLHPPLYGELRALYGVDPARW